MIELEQAQIQTVSGGVQRPEVDAVIGAILSCQSKEELREVMSQVPSHWDIALLVTILGPETELFLDIPL